MSIESIDIRVNKADATLTRAITLTAGMAGLTANFEFSSDWDGLAKTVVARAGSSSLGLTMVNNSVTIPASLLQNSGVQLALGVTGADGSTTRIPTIWCAAGIVYTSAQAAEVTNLGTVTQQLVDQMMAYCQTAANATITSGTATIGSSIGGTPACTVTITGSAGAKVMNFAFDHLKVNGIASAVYDTTTKILTITLDSGTVISVGAIAEAYDDVQELIEDVEEAEEDRETAEAARVSAETGRVSAETIRVSSESGRATAETARGTAETSRATAETARGTAETARSAAEVLRASAESSRASAETGRVSAESSRVSAETARASAESGRFSAETSRVNAETARTSAESGRSSAEETRSNKETQRQTAEGNRATAEENRVSAESARVSAETARVSAENSRASAETARVTAETGRVNAETGRVTAETAREAAKIVAANATIDSATGTPAISVTLTDHQGGGKDINFAFSKIKGPKGDKGDTGNTGPQGQKGDTGDPGVVQSVNGISQTAVVLDGSNINVDNTAQSPVSVKAAITQQSEQIVTLETKVDNRIKKFYTSNLLASSVSDSDDGGIRSLKIFGKGSQTQDEMTYSCNGTETGAYDITYSGIIYEFTMPIVTSASILVFNTTNKKLYLNGTEISLTVVETASGTAITFIKSPSPSYPQTIHSVVNPNMTVCGKNLIDSSLLTFGAIMGNGTIDTLQYSMKYLILHCDPNTNYTISNCAGNSRYTIFTYKNKNDWTVQNKYANRYGGSASTDTSLSITTESSIHYLGINVHNTHYSDIQLEIGSSATAKEPYKSTTATLAKTLNAIPVASGGNVTIDGQQYIADYVDIEAKKIVRRISCINAKDVQWKKSESSTNFYFNNQIATYTEVGIDFRTALLVLSNKYLGHTYQTLAERTDKSIFGYDGNEGPSIAIYDTSITSLADFNTFISNNDVIIYYVKTTISKESLTDAEVADFLAMRSYYPVTNHTVTSTDLSTKADFLYPCSLENFVEYVKEEQGDTRTFIYDMQDISDNAYINAQYAEIMAEIALDD